MIESVNNGQSSNYNVGLLREKPLFLKTHAEVNAFLEGKMKRNSTLLEDTCTLSTNNSYRNHTSYEMSGTGDDKTCLDFGFLIRDQTSSLKGSLDSENDVDFYNFTIPYNRTLQNYFSIDIHMQMPEGSNYRLSLYDEYGNQVGIAQQDGENQKTLSIPNWDTKTSKYCIKVENEDGSPVNPDDSYKISFGISENKDADQTDAIREAFVKCNDDYVKHNDTYEKSLAEYNRLLQQAEENYSKEVDALHQKQYDALPAEKKYTGTESVSQLLERMAAGEQLDTPEQEYLNIFAGLSDVQKAEKEGELHNDISKDICTDLEQLGLSKDEISGMSIQINSSGKVTVQGIENEQTQADVEKILSDKYSSTLYGSYIGIADSVKNLPANTYEYAQDVQEIDRFLANTTNGNVSIENIYLTRDGKIGGLPEQISHYINDTKNNVKAMELKDQMKNVIQNKELYGSENIPRFEAAFHFEGESLTVTDSGFSSNVAMLVEQMNQRVQSNSMYGNTYTYRFQKIL